MALFFRVLYIINFIIVYLGRNLVSMHPQLELTVRQNMVLLPEEMVLYIYASRIKVTERRYGIMQLVVLLSQV